MTNAARDLLLLLQQLAERELSSEQLDEARPRARLALSRAVAPADAEHLEYAGYELDSLGPGLDPRVLQGLATTRSQLLLTELVGELESMSDDELSPLPAELGLEPEQLRAACFAAYWILNSLEWESRDRAIPAEFPPEKRDSMLAACLRSLRSFRATGEP